jgi:hypothetical protein
MALLKPVPEPKPTRPRRNLRLDLGSGDHPRDGFEGVDIAALDGVKHVVDLFHFPWPFESGSVRELNISHFVEHIPHYRPEWLGKDGWFMFWEEVQRICKPGALIHVVHPYVQSSRAFWDPTHERFIHEMTWYYLDAGWRKANALDHYTTADFEVVVISGNGIADDVATRNQEYQTFARAHYWNVLADLVVELKRR